ncbi:hypothetical protein [Candidatus Nitrosocosmicus hydrocola]|uniref:hypothetical protein n=1 Tax=Candidatus Nitrosocosmicus hydrocola TaxID=1826872 RepID=UPI0011E5F363|nr:hypothetical protein [Candidatus Nitrosocosmicus hydrocola]
MNKLNLFVVLTIVAAASMFGAMVTPALAQDNMTMEMDNATMPMDMGNMTMTMDNSTDMAGNTTQ